MDVTRFTAWGPTGTAARKILRPRIATTRLKTSELRANLPKQHAQYADKIQLYDKYQHKDTTGPEAATALRDVVLWFYERHTPKARGDGHAWYNELEIHQKTKLLDDYLTTLRPTQAVPAHIHDQLDTIWAYTSRRLPVEDIETISALSSDSTHPDARISVWAGDITLLPVTAIVNPGAPELLGCTRRGHMCLDHVIHSAAGHRLRRDCQTIMQGGLLPVGHARITRGYWLPAKFVIHTVGPMIISDEASGDDREKLQLAYTNCLEAAENLPGRRRSIAFPQISAGVYSYPKAAAAAAAIEAVRSYFIEHPQSNIWRVFFVVLEKADDIHFHPLLKQEDRVRGFPTYELPPPTFSIWDAADTLCQMPCLVISAGAGVSVSAGFLHWDSVADFLRLFPHTAARLPHGTTLASALAYKDWSTPYEKWGFYVKLYVESRQRMQTEAGSLYEVLAEIVSKVFYAEDGEPEFRVVTTNWDGGFSLRNWPADKIYSLHGSMTSFQCPDSCGMEVDADQILQALRSNFNSRTEMITGQPGVPCCKKCNKEVICRMHRFVPDNDLFTENEQHITNYMKERSGQLVVLEIGAGFETPDRLRYFNESMVEDGTIRTLIRINIDGDEEVPWEWTGTNQDPNIEGNMPRAISIKADATVALQWIVGQMNVAWENKAGFEKLDRLGVGNKRRMEERVPHDAEIVRKKRRVI